MHLEVAELEWAPYGFYEDGQWKGFDIDLLEKVAAELNFDYTIQRYDKDASETWTEFAMRATAGSDLLVSYWLHSPERRMMMNQLVGVVNADLVLLVHKPIIVKQSTLERTLTFTAPFTPALWGLLVAALVVSGLVMTFLEHDYADRGASGGCSPVHGAINSDRVPG